MVLLTTRHRDRVRLSALRLSGVAPTPDGVLLADNGDYLIDDNGSYLTF